MNFIVSAVTDIGNTKDTNQDSFVIRSFNTSQGHMVLAVLCDGMGGLAKGELASGSLVHAFGHWAEERLPILSKAELKDVEIAEEWATLVREYNEKIKLYGKKSAIRLGTTVTAVLLTENQYYILNVGDTRAYELKDTLSILTKDQTVVAREVERGNLTPEEALTDSRRSVLLQCVGASDEVYPDFFVGKTSLNAVYMLCTDGFRHEISEEEIYAYLNPNNMLNSENMKQNMTALIEINKQRNERDNITVLSIRTF